MSFQVFLGMQSTPKLSKYDKLSPFTQKAINDFLLICIHQDLLYLLQNIIKNPDMFLR